MKNFYEIYRQVLESSKTQLEALRKKMLYRLIGCVVAAAFCAIMGIYLSNDAIMMIGMMLCIFLAIILLMGPRQFLSKSIQRKSSSRIYQGV